MRKINFEKANNLLITKYKATIITIQQFKEAVYGFNRDDLSDDVSTLSEGMINNENAVFYLINDVTVLNDNCTCVDPQMYPSGKTLPLPLSGFMPYILFIAELSEDKSTIINYAKWGSFSDNIFDELCDLKTTTKWTSRIKFIKKQRDKCLPFVFYLLWIFLDKFYLLYQFE